MACLSARSSLFGRLSSATDWCVSILNFQIFKGLDNNITYGEASYLVVLVVYEYIVSY